MQRSRFVLFLIWMSAAALLSGCVLKPNPIYKPYSGPRKNGRDAADREKKPREDGATDGEADFGDEGVVDEQASYSPARLDASDGLVADRRVWRLANALIPFLNTPYRYGGEDTTGVDCSGLVKSVYETAFGISLPHKAAYQFRDRRTRAINRKRLTAGDLVFFYDRRYRRINHVGIYLSDGYFIHSMSRKGVVISSLEGKYWKKYYAGARRLLRNAQ